MNYDISNDDAVMNDINMLKSHIDLRKIFIDVRQRNRRQRIGGEITRCVSNVLKRVFDEYKSACKCIKAITVLRESRMKSYWKLSWTTAAATYMLICCRQTH